MEVCIEPSRYEIQLWWEIQPFLSLASGFRASETRDGLREKEEGIPRAGGSMSSMSSHLEKTDGTTNREKLIVSLPQRQPSEVVLGSSHARGPSYVPYQ